MTSAAIEIDGLTKDYALGFWRKRMRRSLDNLSLRVEDGEIFGFLGPNGAGKTTTLKLLMGLIFPTAGTARIRGKSIDDVNMHREIGFLPEQPYFYDYLTARELLDYYARFFGFAAADRRERVARFLERVGLTAAADIQLRKFFQGHASACGNRVAGNFCTIPRWSFWTSRCPDSIPWAAVRSPRHHPPDLKNQRLHRLLFHLHILSDAEMLCDRVAVLVDGKLQGVGAPGEIVSMDVVTMEILFELKEGCVLPQDLASATKKTGAHYRAEVPEAQLYATLEKLRGCDARILSVQPVRPSLEEYFLRMVNREKAASHAVEVLAR